MERIPFQRTTEELLGRVEKKESGQKKVFYDRENLDRLIKEGQPKEKPPFASLLEEELAEAMQLIDCSRRDVRLYTTIGSPIKNAHAFVEFNMVKPGRPDRVNLAVAGKNIGLDEKNVVFNFNSEEIDPAEGFENPVFKAKIKEVAVRIILKEMKWLDEEKNLKLTDYVLKNIVEIVDSLRAANKGGDGLVVINDIIQESKKAGRFLEKKLMETLQGIKPKEQS